jgi:hypothetical protein
MAKRKKAGWLGVNKTRTSSTKAMREEKLAIRWRQFMAKSATKKLEPISDSFGTRMYPTPKDPPNAAKIYG